MSNKRNDRSKISFAGTFVVPALLIFLIPVVTLVFFWMSQRHFDGLFRESTLEQIRADASLDAQQRQQLTELYREVPFSEMLKHAEFAKEVPGNVKSPMVFFRWAIRLAIASIGVGILVPIVAGVCVLYSRRSQQAQHLCLAIGWHVLRIYGALQTVVQGAMFVALSYWVPAVLFQRFSIKLTFVVGAAALIATAAVLKVIFKRPDTTTEIAGHVIDRSSAPAFWQGLETICQKVGTKLPDQVVAGINDQFFVTEMPVKVAGKSYQGRTLFVSLSLLKQMDGTEADAVLAHEMAHFSGNDTVYTRKIAPLRIRFQMYLQALYENAMTLPVFYCMRCFWAFFELSLAEHSRAREFRADRIAAQTTSPRSFAGGLLRIVAYSDFRGNVQQGLYAHERSLASADILAKIESGFHAHARVFAGKPDIGNQEMAHPFDTHPPLTQRFEAVGVPLDAREAQSLVDRQGDGRWFATIEHAERLEREQWNQFEENFRAYHEQSLPYRLLPNSDEEREIVERAFPEVVIDGHPGSLVLTCDTVRYTEWEGFLLMREITKMTCKNDKLTVYYARAGKNHRATIPLKTLGSEAIDTLNLYYTRYLTAVAEQSQKALEPQGHATQE